MSIEESNSILRPMLLIKHNGATLTWRFENAFD
jgi:hypothetical protein